MDRRSLKYAEDSILGQDENGLPIWLSGAGNGFKSAHYAMGVCAAGKQTEVYGKYGLPVSPSTAHQPPKPTKVTKVYGDGGLSEDDILSMETTKSNTINRLVSSMICYQEKRFDEAVELLYPVIGDCTRASGGSLAQMDVFNILLVVAALRSAKKSN